MWRYKKYSNTSSSATTQIDIHLDMLQILYTTGVYIVENHLDDRVLINQYIRPDDREIRKFSKFKNEFYTFFLDGLYRQF